MLSIIVACLLAALSCVSGKCSGGCKEPILLYEDLKCSPIFSNENDCCPAEYDCSHIVERALDNQNGCYFRGKHYKLQEEIDDKHIYGNCKISCKCSHRLSGEVGFVCAIVDCPEWLGYRPQPQCHFKYELDKCCNVGEVCPPFNATCKVGNKVYHEGQKFDSVVQKCTECVCGVGFAGKFEEPFCKKVQCVDEVDYGKKIEKFCAPSYFNIDGCCPYTWICPELTDHIISAAPLDKHTNAKCKFGDRMMNIGDKFTRTSEGGGHLSCECRIPPYLTCIQNFQYPAYAPY